MKEAKKNIRKKNHCCSHAQRSKQTEVWQAEEEYGMELHNGNEWVLQESRGGATHPHSVEAACWMEQA